MLNATLRRTAAPESVLETAADSWFSPTATDDVERALLAQAYARVPQTVAMTLVAVLVFFCVMLPFFPLPALAGWVAAFVLVSGGRLLLWQAWMRRGSQAGDIRPWQRAFFASMLLAGAVWSGGALLLLPGAGATERMLLLLMLLAVSAVSMVAMAAQVQAMTGFVLTVMVPATVGVAAAGDAMALVAAAMMAAGAMALLLSGRTAAQALRGLLTAEHQLALVAADNSLALERAEAASQAKTRFLANMSHELRTPLNAVIGAAQLMRADGGDAAQRRHLVDAIQHSGNNLLGLIENILDIARIESGELRLAARPFDLGDCVDAALATAALSAHAKGLVLAGVVDARLPLQVLGDAGRVRQILLNLLGNAVKFTASGEVALHLAPGASADEVHIRIRDTGIGIPAHALPHIFEAFRQADEGAGRRFGGSGLGLAIVRQLVQAMGGRISVSSTPGQGACFELWLPLPATTAVARPPCQGRAVAYVEPHATSAQALHALLLRLGCRPTRCESAAALRAWCQAHAEARPPARLLVCSDLPELADWLEAVADLLDPAQLIGMTRQDNAEADAARRQLALPASLAKPVAGAALAARLNDDDGSDLQAPQALLSDAQLQRIVHVLVVEDDALNQAIVGRMLHHAGCRVSTADDGLQALARLRSQSFDLVLMDCQMPGMDGLELTRRVRAGEAGTAARALPIVALTANAFAEDRAECLAAGMDDFLSKPVLAQTLLATVARWTGRATATAVPAAAPRSPAVAGTTGTTAATADPRHARSARPVYDPSVLAALPMVADGSQPEAADEMLALFTQALPAQQARLQALLAAPAGQAAPHTELGRLLHTLKSSAANVGALALSAVAADGEQLLRRGAQADALRALGQTLDDALAQWHAAMRARAGSQGMPATRQPAEAQG